MDGTCGLNVDNGQVVEELMIAGWIRVGGEGDAHHPANGVYATDDTSCYSRVFAFTPTPTMADCDALPSVPEVFCRSSGDPHIKPFLGNTQIHPQVEGDYMLFVNPKIAVAARHARNNHPNAVTGNTAVALTGEMLQGDLIEVYSKNPHMGRSEHSVLFNKVLLNDFEELCDILSSRMCGCTFIESASDIHGHSRLILRFDNVYTVRLDFAHPTWGWMNVFITASSNEITGPNGYARVSIEDMAGIGSGDGSADGSASGDGSGDGSADGSGDGMASGDDPMFEMAMGLCDDIETAIAAYRFGSSPLFACNQDPFTYDVDTYCFDAVAWGDRRRQAAPVVFADVIAACPARLITMATDYCDACTNPLLTTQDFDSCLFDACADIDSGVSSARGQRSACFETVMMLKPVNERGDWCLSENKIYVASWGLCLTAVDLGMENMEYEGKGLCLDVDGKTFPKYQHDAVADNAITCSRHCNRYPECLSVNFYVSTNGLATTKRCLLHVDAGVRIAALDMPTSGWSYNDGNGATTGVHPVASTQVGGSGEAECFSKLMPTPAPTTFCPFGHTLATTMPNGCCRDPKLGHTCARGGICISAGDPHIMQFNMQTGHSYEEGTYLLYHAQDKFSVWTRHARNGAAAAVAGNTAVYFTGPWLGGLEIEYLAPSQHGVVRTQPEWRIGGVAVANGAAVCEALEDIVCNCRWAASTAGMHIDLDQSHFIRFITYGDYGYTNVYISRNPALTNPSDNGMCFNAGTPTGINPYEQYRIESILATADACTHVPFSDPNRLNYCKAANGGNQLRRLAQPEMRRLTHQQMIDQCAIDQTALHTEVTTICEPCAALSAGQEESCMVDGCNMGTTQALQMADSCLFTILVMAPYPRDNICPAGTQYNDATISCDLVCGPNGKTPRGCCPATTRTPPRTSICSSTGDPHTTGFDGSYNHAYTDGDYMYYKGSQLEVVGRHKQHANGVAGINAISINGAYTGYNHIEFFAQTTENSLRMTNVFKLNGAEKTVTEMCHELRDWTCKCGMMGNWFIISFDEFTQVKAKVFSTNLGWMDLYIYLNPTLQNTATDTGMCTYSGNEWSNNRHRDALAFHDDRLTCAAFPDPKFDPFTEQHDVYCPACTAPGCRRRADQARDIAFRRFDNCGTIEAEVDTICAACHDASKRSDCKFDACTMNDVAFAQSFAENCFNEEVELMTPPDARVACKANDPTTTWDSATGSCVTIPAFANVDGFEFMGYGYCEDEHEFYFSYYAQSDASVASTGAQYDTIEKCRQLCVAEAGCGAFEWLSEHSECYFNFDKTVTSTDLENAEDIHGVKRFRYGNYAGVHPVYETDGNRDHYCFEKIPAPTGDCPDLTGTYHATGAPETADVVVMTQTSPLHGTVARNGNVEWTYTQDPTTCVISSDREDLNGTLDAWCGSISWDNGLEWTPQLPTDTDGCVDYSGSWDTGFSNPNFNPVTVRQGGAFGGCHGDVRLPQDIIRNRVQWTFTVQANGEIVSDRDGMTGHMECGQIVWDNGQRWGPPRPEPTMEPTPSPTNEPTQEPTVDPTPFCPATGQGFQTQLGCCPAYVRDVPQAQKCKSTGDPHVTQFSGETNHAYTEGDYELYIGDKLQVYERHTHGGITNGVTGNAAVMITGDLLGGHTVEIFAKTTNPAITNLMSQGRRDATELRLDGNLVTADALCQLLLDSHLVCKCEHLSDAQGAATSRHHGAKLIMSWDEYTQIDLDIYDTYYGWMNVLLQLNNELQRTSDGGMCSHRGSEWSNQNHRDLSAYHDYRLNCDNDPFTDSYRNSLCKPCTGCRRRAGSFEEEMIRRRQGNNNQNNVIANCGATLRGNCENICQICPAGVERTNCVFDGCGVTDERFSRDAAEVCFNTILRGLPDTCAGHAERRNLCATNKPGTQYHSGMQRCRPSASQDIADYDFIGWGKCREEHDEVYPSYETTGSAQCAAKCNDHPECKSFVINPMRDVCILNVDDGTPPPPAGVLPMGTWTPNPLATGPHPVCLASNPRFGFLCYEKQPTPAPVPACPAGVRTMHDGSCCPATIPRMTGTQFCSITGDPHVTQFDGQYGDIYVNGDFRVYKNNEIEISQRASKSLANIRPAGVVALKVSGSILDDGTGEHTIEIQTANQNPPNILDPILYVPTIRVMYKGVPSTTTAICADLLAKNLVCTCVASDRIFMFTIGSDYLVRLDMYNPSVTGWSNFYMVASNAKQSASDTGVCTRTGNRVQDGGVNTVNPYPNDRYNCVDDPFSDGARGFFCPPARRRADMANVNSVDDILNDCLPSLRSAADNVCGAGCDDVPDVDTNNCVLDVCLTGSVDGADLQRAACKLSAVVNAAEDEKDALCDDDETYSKELDTCVTPAEAAQVLPAGSPVAAPTARPTTVAQGLGGDDGKTTIINNDDQSTTMIVLAVMAVGMVVILALGVLIGQRFSKPATPVQAPAMMTTAHAAGPTSVEMISTDGGLPKPDTTWKDKEGSSRFITVHDASGVDDLTARNANSSAL